ncbi:hypothetical protein BpHYR1_031080 [Brachionus plicatilis]|uniref:Uncharacterized protein n=1 Tax=Brachionus plicatilis TaxID=10195 RepID=A0A3M7RIC3_BRAPC|nr:hypothetical protein BpHYR1_031080 [Brachionus plicatilis]
MKLLKYINELETCYLLKSLNLFRNKSNSNLNDKKFIDIIFSSFSHYFSSRMAKTMNIIILFLNFEFFGLFNPNPKNKKIIPLCILQGKDVARRIELCQIGVYLIVRVLLTKWDTIGVKGSDKCFIKDNKLGNYYMGSYGIKCIKVEGIQETEMSFQI